MDSKNHHEETLEELANSRQIIQPPQPEINYSLHENEISNKIFYNTFIHQYSVDANCALCNCIITNPVSCSECKKSFCMECAEKYNLIRNIPNASQCPCECRNSFLYNNRILQNFLTKLQFVCRDCKLIFDYSEAKNHYLEQCPELPKNKKKSELLKNSNDCLRIKLKTQVASNTELKEKINNLKTAKEEKSKKEEKAAELQKQIKELTERIQHSLYNKNMLEKEKQSIVNESLKKESSELKESNDLLRNTLKETEEEKEKLKEGKLNFEKEKEDLKAKIKASIQQTLTELTSEKSSLEKEMKEEKEIYEKEKEKIEKLTLEKEQMEKEEKEKNEDLQKKLNNLQKEKEIIESEISKMEKETLEILKEKDTLNSQVEEAKKKNESFEKEDSLNEVNIIEEEEIGKGGEASYSEKEEEIIKDDNYRRVDSLNNEQKEKPSEEPHKGEDLYYDGKLMIDLNEYQKLTFDNEEEGEKTKEKENANEGAKEKQIAYCDGQPFNLDEYQSFLPVNSEVDLNAFPFNDFEYSGKNGGNNGQ